MTFQLNNVVLAVVSVVGTSQLWHLVRGEWPLLDITRLELSLISMRSKVIKQDWVNIKAVGLLLCHLLIYKYHKLHKRWAYFLSVRSVLVKFRPCHDIIKKGQPCVRYKQKMAYLNIIRGKIGDKNTKNSIQI